jgi:steroid delta-isomerase
MRRSREQLQQVRGVGGGGSLPPFTVEEEPMATTEQIRAIVDRYIELFSAGDVDGWSQLFAADAFHEDPVGTPPNEGREAVAAFYVNTQAMFGSVRLSAVEEPIVLGNEAVVTLRASAGAGESRVVIPRIVDLMTFNDAGEIASLRAFWDMASITPDP